MGEIIRHVLAVLPAFLLACLAVAALPGPSTALFLHRTVRDGRAAGLAAVAGNEIGVFCWALAAGAGLTGLLRANRWLYLALHIVGAVVLVYLDVMKPRSPRRSNAVDPRFPLRRHQADPHDQRKLAGPTVLVRLTRTPHHARRSHRAIWQCAPAAVP